MDLHTYQHDVAPRTMNYELGPQTQLTQLALGIVGEFSELKSLHYEVTQPTREQVKDEGGDTLWYIANTCNTIKRYTGAEVNLTDLETDNVYEGEEPETLIDEAPLYYGKIADIVKKTVAQGHVLDFESIVLNVTELLHILLAVFDYYNLTIEEVCDYNHKKILKRYPDGFEASRSINREV
jgi:hypothetical protein